MNGVDARMIYESILMSHCAWCVAELPDTIICRDWAEETDKIDLKSLE